MENIKRLPAVNLRAIEMEDLKQLRDWRNTKELKDNFREYRLLNMLHQEDWLRSVTKDKNWLMFAVENADGTLVGACGWTYIDWLNRRAESGLYIGDEKMRGMKIGTAAFHEMHKIAYLELDLNMTYGQVYGYNPAIGMSLNYGYTVVGKWRNEHYYMGKHWDTICLDMSKEEWFKLYGKDIVGDYSSVQSIDPIEDYSNLKRN